MVIQDYVHEIKDYFNGFIVQVINSNTMLL